MTANGMSRRGRCDSSAGTVRISKPENAKISSSTARRKLIPSKDRGVKFSACRKNRPPIARMMRGRTLATANRLDAPEVWRMPIMLIEVITAEQAMIAAARPIGSAAHGRSAPR